MITTFLIAVLINIFVFIPAYLWKTDKLTDISYSLTFFVLACYGLYINNFELPYLILFLAITAWAFRLGAYLLIRIKKMGRDKRFDGMREDFWRFFKFWFFQGISVWVIMVPSLLFFNSEISYLGIISYTGIAIWLLGLLIETFSDLQKYKFINNPQNKGVWIETGLWKYSRHPNYFGEITLWVGVYLFVFPHLDFAQNIFGLISPLYIAFIIIFISGIPMLEKAADKRWGENPSYQNYKKRTSVLVPWFNKK